MAPRDGSGIYSQPFPAVVEGTTIESTVYNGYTADVTIDLNTPRPISSGGTGANNAADAMSNLGGEGSKIEVTNYDSHAFTAGSFYSKASASNPPVAGHAFAGICYVAVVSGIATSDMFIEVRDRDEATQPGSLFVRQKKNGTWSGWLKAVGTTTGATPPTAPTDGMLWWDPTQGKLFIWYSDPNTAQWVEAVATPDLGPDDFVSVDVAQSFTELEKKTARSNIYAAPFDALAYNGMQINGSFDVSQENAQGTSVTLNGKYVCDGWRLVISSAAVVAASSQPNGTIFAGFMSFLTLQVTTASPTPAASDYTTLQTSIEGWRISRLAWGLGGQAQPITIGFWSCHTRTGTYSVSIRNSNVTRSYVTTYTQNVSNAVEYKTITIPGCPDGSWQGSSATGIILEFVVAIGTTQTAPSANTWLTGNYDAAPGQVNGVAATSDNFRITGVVVLPGIEVPSAARSPLIMRPYDQELVMCQRYYEQWPLANGAYAPIAVGIAMTTTTAQAVAVYKVIKRAPPTLLISAPTDFMVWGSGGAGFGVTALSAASADLGSATLSFTSGGMVANQATGLFRNASVAAKLAFDARL